jgi:hypothetical protein
MARQMGLVGLMRQRIHELQNPEAK